VVGDAFDGGAMIGLTFTQAIKLVQSGKLARRRSWYSVKADSREHIGRDEDGIYWSTNPQVEDSYVAVDYSINTEDILAEDWEELEVYPEIRCRRVKRVGHPRWLDDRYCAQIPMHRLTTEQITNLMNGDSHRSADLTHETKEGLIHESNLRNLQLCL